MRTERIARDMTEDARQLAARLGERVGLSLDVREAERDLDGDGQVVGGRVVVDAYGTPARCRTFLAALRRFEAAGAVDVPDVPGRTARFELEAAHAGRVRFVVVIEDA